MPLILAIEPDPRHATLVASLSPRYLDAEIVVTSSVEAALDVMQARAPDLLLTPPLLSTRDDTVLALRVRQFNEQGVEVPILVIPMLAVEPLDREPIEKPGGLLTRIRKQKVTPPPSKGCGPEVFAAQIREYLVRAAAERRDREETARADMWIPPQESASAPLLGELLPQPSEMSTLRPVRAEQVEPESDVRPATALDDRAQVQPVVLDVEVPTVIEPSDSTLVLAAATQELPHNDPADCCPPAEVRPPALPDADVPAAAEELWAPLPLSQVQLIAPLEGPTVKPRRIQKPAAPAKTSRRTPSAPARAAKPTRRAGSRHPKPIEDEWGLYDPEQCGFAALLERLDALSEHPGEQASPKTRSAIMRR